MTSLHIAVVAHSAVKQILPYISCLFFGKVKSLAYYSTGHLRSKICCIVTGFSFSGMTPLWRYHKEKSARCLPNISEKHMPQVLLYLRCPRITFELHWGVYRKLHQILEVLIKPWPYHNHDKIRKSCLVFAA